VTQQINLFNPVFLKQRKVFSAGTMAQALGVLLAGVLAVAFHARQNVNALQLEADVGRERLAQREERLGKVKAEFTPRQKSAELEAQLAEAEAYIAALRKVSGTIQRGELGNTSGYAEYFKALARQNPSGVWLTGVSISGAGNELGVQGRALEPALVPAYLGRLAREPVMRGKAFASLKISQPGAGGPQAAPSAAPITPTVAPFVAPFVEFSLDATQGEAAK
jgi:Tfp pilus assembly protein PilN